METSLTPRTWKLAIILTGALLLSACGSIARAPIDPAMLRSEAAPSPLDAFRFTENDQRAGVAFLKAWQAQRQDHHGELTVLAVSSGGANGAYGAGVLVGWSRSGERPAFDLVTGVSTGALIAPFAFLGSEWDDELEAAFTDAEAARLTHSGWGLLRAPSLFASGPLNDLVAKHVDESLLAAIAQQHQSGRRLLVASTNLDLQATVLWDLGSIALAGQVSGEVEAAIRLFREALVASSSIPGVFPPVMMDGDGVPGGYQEMHVDGGVTTPFVLAPADTSFWRTEAEMTPGRLYVIINGELAPSPSVTEGWAVPILTRAFDTMSKADARAHLTTSAAFAATHGAELRYAAIPPELGADSLAFELEAMRRLFDAGVAAGEAGRAFVSADPPRSGAR